MKEEHVIKGIADAMDNWLAQRPVSMPDIIYDAFKVSARKWLDDHEDEIIDKVVMEITSICRE
jgi:hypothetical protein